MNRWIDAIGQTIFFIALYFFVNIITPTVLVWLGQDITIINQVLAGSILFILAILIINMDNLTKNGWFTGFSGKEFIKTIEMSVASIIFVNLLLVYLFPDFINQYMPDDIKNQFTSIGNSDPFMVLLAVGILAPVAEEVLFRGAIFTVIAKKFNKYAAIIVSAVLFAVIHLNIYQGSYAFFIGVFVGIILMKTGSLWLPIIFHIVYNTFSSVYASFDPDLMELLYVKTYIIPIIGVILLVDGLRFFLSKGGRR